jgi:hypothetical protein
MPTVTQVLTVQPARGKFQQCLELGGKWKKLREQAGAKERMYTNTAGALLIVIRDARLEGVRRDNRQGPSRLGRASPSGGDAIESQPSRERL